MYDVAFGNWHVLWGLNMPGDLWQPPLSLSLSYCLKTVPRYTFFRGLYQKEKEKKLLLTVIYSFIVLTTNAQPYEYQHLGQRGRF